MLNFAEASVEKEIEKGISDNITKKKKIKH